MAISMHRKDPDPPKDKGWIQRKTRFWIQLNIKIQIKGLVFKRTKVVVNRLQPPTPAPVLSLSRNLQQLSPSLTKCHYLTPWVFWVQPLFYFILQRNDFQMLTDCLLPYRLLGKSEINQREKELKQENINNKKNRICFCRIQQQKFF